MLKKNNKNVLIIPDMQAPFQHPDTLDFLEWGAEIVEPDLIVDIGDELDQYTLSRYTHSPDGMAGGEEYDAAMEFMQDLYGLFPDAKCCTSNHLDRVFKRATDAGIPRGYLKSIHEFMEAPSGWEWKDRWVIDDICYEHGDRASGFTAHRNLAIANFRSTVVGHNHAHGGVVYISNGPSTIFGLNVSCLIDVTQYAFAYTKKDRQKPVLGLGAVMKGIPFFIPMITKTNGRWDYKWQTKNVLA